MSSPSISRQNRIRIKICGTSPVLMARISIQTQLTELISLPSHSTHLFSAVSKTSALPNPRFRVIPAFSVPQLIFSAVNPKPSTNLSASITTFIPSQTSSMRVRAITMLIRSSPEKNDDAIRSSLVTKEDAFLDSARFLVRSSTLFAPPSSL